VALPTPLPAARLQADDFLASLADDDLVYFLCNVGDADAQLILTPHDPDLPGRRAIIVDAGLSAKLPALINALGAEGLLTLNGAAPGAIALLVATHPHSDHIRGMRRLLDDFGPEIQEFWDPGYYHTTSNYHQMMAGIEVLQDMVYSQPSSGLKRWLGRVAITVLSPSIQLRNRFDTYGTEINDSSISLRIEYPASRVVQRNDDRSLVDSGRTTALVLGADAQTLSWSFALTDFPRLHSSNSAAAQAIGAARGGDPLRGQILKVSHHGSKRGVNLELVERIAPLLTLVSSARESPRYNFPHTIAQEIVREAQQPTASTGAARTDDHELGIFYTCDVDDADQDVGSIAVVLPMTGNTRLWRFGDASDDAIDLTNGMRWT